MRSHGRVVCKAGSRYEFSSLAETNPSAMWGTRPPDFRLRIVFAISLALLTLGASPNGVPVSVWGAHPGTARSGR
jgi:hypothetical protein